MSFNLHKTKQKQCIMLRFHWRVCSGITLNSSSLIFFKGLQWGNCKNSTSGLGLCGKSTASNGSPSLSPPSSITGPTQVGEIDLSFTWAWHPTSSGEACLTSAILSTNKKHLSPPKASHRVHLVYILAITFFKSRIYRPHSGDIWQPMVN